jgi:AraC family transcriptional regulator, transcriptional activator of pobA
MHDLPIYSIDRFELNANTIYANRLSDHIQKHHFIQHPHKHDFYACIIFTRGSGEHEIDFIKYHIKPGNVFFLRPGQMHNWRFSSEPDGFIFFHTREFYDVNFQNRQLQDYPFYSSYYNAPALKVSIEKLKDIHSYFDLLLTEFNKAMPLRQNKLASLVDLIYVDLFRLYPSNTTAIAKQGYLQKLKILEALVDKHFKIKKSRADYAVLMNMSGKHLNRIVKETLDKTVSDIIADRIILEAKRLLALKKYSAAQIADELGFTDQSYFSRFFKKHTNLTPLEFADTV